jgi:predicted site-specific integrase-resolvase
VVAEATEITSGLNDERPKLKKLLTNSRVGELILEHQDRLTHCGYGHSAMLLEQHGRRVEDIFPTDRSNDLVDDFVAVITSMAVRIYGRCSARRRVAQIQTCVKQYIGRVEAADVV